MNLTIEQVKHLTSEQQEALASIEIQHLKNRERLLDLARTYRVPRFAGVAPPLLLFLAIVPTFLISTDRLFLVLAISLTMMFIAFGLCFVISSEVKSTNRRIDALFELLEMDKKHPDA
jgi:hypothetical protein